MDYGKIGKQILRPNCKLLLDRRLIVDEGLFAQSFHLDRSAVDNNIVIFNLLIAVDISDRNTSGNHRVKPLLHLRR